MDDWRLATIDCEVDTDEFAQTVSGVMTVVVVAVVAIDGSACVEVKECRRLYSVSATVSNLIFSVKFWSIFSETNNKIKFLMFNKKQEKKQPEAMVVCCSSSKISFLHMLRIDSRLLVIFGSSGGVFKCITDAVV